MERVGKKHWLSGALCMALLVFLSWGASAQEATRPPASQQKVDWGIFLPAGEGQFQTTVYCSTCHSLQPIVSERRGDEAGWVQTVQTMAFTNGANIQDDDIAVITKYLARFFGPSTPKLELPIHINSAPKQLLLLIGTLSDGDVEKILNARAKEEIKDFGALEDIVGKEKLSKYKSVVTFQDGPEKSK